MLRSPFKEEGLNLYGLFGKITKGKYPPISDVYSADLRRLVDGMLILDPAKRLDIDVSVGRWGDYKLDCWDICA